MRPWEARWHDQWIAIDPNVFGGQPYVRGTSRTVAEVQEIWKQTGVYAAEIRKRFPDLTEAQLGAAVTWSPRGVIKHAFVADWEGPPRRRLFIWSEAGAEDANGVSGWMFAYEDMGNEGEWQPCWDSWEETFERILLYPPEYAPPDIHLA